MPFESVKPTINSISYVLLSLPIRGRVGPIFHLKIINIMVIEFGAMSSMYSIEADDKLAAYFAICLFYQRNAHMVAIYSPEEACQDQWLSIDGKISARLDEIFGGENAFDLYGKANGEKIEAAYHTIKQLV